MWKAVLPGVFALVTLGLSLVSGEVIKRGTEHKPDLALASTSGAEQSGAPAGSQRSASNSSNSEQTTQPVAAARPVALVIGNSAYPDAGLPLSHPVNNARAIAAALRDKGFQVEYGENLGKPAMEAALEAFQARIQPGVASLIFFSGFGIQAGRQTYLIPVNAHIWTEADVRRLGVSIEPVLSEIDAKGAGAKLVVLDASRRNPFERRFRSSSAGLAAIQAPDETLMMYSAAPGKVVSDGEGELSPLTRELIAQLDTSNPSADEVFHQTQLAVSHASHRKQVPWVSSSLVQDFVFGAESSHHARYSAR
jgi:uncharacterized caspase-like protein